MHGMQKENLHKSGGVMEYLVFPTGTTFPKMYGTVPTVFAILLYLIL